MATMMGEDGKPTKINFTKSFVIALIDEISNKTESLTIESLTKENGKLNLAYNYIKKQEPGSASFRFVLILIVDKKYEAPIIIEQANLETEKPLLGGDLDKFGCKPSAGYSWSILEKKCIQPFVTKYILRGKEINAYGNAALLFSKNNKKAEIMGSKFSPNLILTKKGNKNHWVSGNLKLSKSKNNHFILKEKNKEIAKAELRN